MSTPVAQPAGYDTSVFVNCPFDPLFQPLFRALVFTIEYCGFHTRCALEVDDSGETRAEKIIRLIRDSRLGIHDISRTEATVVDGEPLPRFNMPFEFGVFTGFKYGGTARQKRKAILVLDKHPYRYQKFLSDIAGQDIRSHGGDPTRLIHEVRAWLRAQAGARELDGAEHIAGQYARFTSRIPGTLSSLKKTDIDLHNYRDFHALVTNWVAEYFGTSLTGTAADAPTSHDPRADDRSAPPKSPPAPPQMTTSTPIEWSNGTIGRIVSANFVGEATLLLTIRHDGVRYQWDYSVRMTATGGLSYAGTWQAASGTAGVETGSASVTLTPVGDGLYTFEGRWVEGHILGWWTMGELAIGRITPDDEDVS